MACWTQWPWGAGHSQGPEVPRTRAQEMSQYPWPPRASGSPPHTLPGQEAQMAPSRCREG